MSVDIPTDDGDQDDGGEYSLTPGTPLRDLAERRAKNNQDLAILVTDYHNRRGTGKTILSLKLACALNRSDMELSPEMAHIDPEPLVDAYSALPKKCPLILDEAEKDLDKFNAASAVARAMREIVSMGRIQEKYLIMNLPASTHIDTDLRALFDVWILVQSKGQALVHSLPKNPYQGQTLNKKMQTLEWSDIMGSHHARDVYRYLTDLKKDHLDGGREGFVPQSKVQERVQKAREEAAREKRDAIIKQVYKHSDLSQRQLGSILPEPLSQQQVGNIVNDR